MHIFHDCFRYTVQRPTINYSLKVAFNIFPEAVAWLKRLLKGRIPVLSTSKISDQRIYKFGAGIARRPIWYKVAVNKNESDNEIIWTWSPDNQTLDSEKEMVWTQCPQLQMASFQGEFLSAEGAFIIIFLHTYKPHPPNNAPVIEIKTEHVFREVLKSMPRFKSKEKQNLETTNDSKITYPSTLTLENNNTSSTTEQSENVN
jgi:hypothetical protein